MGYEMPEILGKRNLDLAAPESADLIVNQQRLSGEIFFEVSASEKMARPSQPRCMASKCQPTESSCAWRQSGISPSASKAEEALRESEERFARLAEAAFEGIAIIVQGVVQDANEQLARMFGYQAL